MPQILLFNFCFTIEILSRFNLKAIYCRDYHFKSAKMQGLTHVESEKKMVGIEQFKLHFISLYKLQSVV